MRYCRFASARTTWRPRNPEPPKTVTRVSALDFTVIAVLPRRRLTCAGGIADRSAAVQGRGGRFLLGSVVISRLSDWSTLVGPGNSTTGGKSMTDHTIGRRTFLTAAAAAAVTGAFDATAGRAQQAVPNTTGTGPAKVKAPANAADCH